MRVATRRLRAAIEIFRPCFPKAEGSAVLKDVKALADALGERRDPDVAIDALEGFAMAMPAPDRPGIRSLAGRYHSEQAEANMALVPFVEAGRLEEIRERVEELAAAARAASADAVEPEAAPEAEPDADPEAEG